MSWIDDHSIITRIPQMMVQTENEVRRVSTAVAKNPLSNELKVAAEIYRCELLGQKVWFGKLVELLDGVSNPNKKISKNTISAAIDTLFDWGIIKAEYGATETGRAGRLLMISNEAKSTITDLYEKYWKDL